MSYFLLGFHLSSTVRESLKKNGRQYALSKAEFIGDEKIFGSRQYSV